MMFLIFRMKYQIQPGQQSLRQYLRPKFSDQTILVIKNIFQAVANRLLIYK